MSDEPTSQAADSASGGWRGEYTKISLEHKKLDHAHEHREQKGQRGMLGWLFGGQDEKAGNIAGLMTLLCFGAISVLLFHVLTTNKWENVDTSIAVLGAILTACLGYLFGRK